MRTDDLAAVTRSGRPWSCAGFAAALAAEKATMMLATSEDETHFCAMPTQRSVVPP
jgi:hypothetical protein